MKSCDICLNRNTCTRDTGTIFGGCNVEFAPDNEAIYRRLDSLEGCGDNPVYAKQTKELRSLLTTEQEVK